MAVPNLKTRLRRCGFRAVGHLNRWTHRKPVICGIYRQAERIRTSCRGGLAMVWSIRRWIARGVEKYEHTSDAAQTAEEKGRKERPWPWRGISAPRSTCNKKTTSSKSNRSHPKPDSDSHSCHGQSRAAVPLCNITTSNIPLYDTTNTHSQHLCDTSDLCYPTRPPSCLQSVFFHAICLYNATSTFLWLLSNTNATRCA